MWDYLIIGGGIVGLTISQNLGDNNKSSTILVLEKESYSRFHGVTATVVFCIQESITKKEL